MTDRKQVSPWASALAALGDGLLLLCALLGGLYSFLSLYDISPSNSLSALYSAALSYERTVVLATAVAAALVALTLWSLPRFRLGLCAVLAAAWVGLAAYLWEFLFPGIQLLGQTVNNLFAHRVGWVEPWELALELSRAEQAQAVTLALCMGTALLALALGWAVVRARRWYLVVVLTLPPLLPGLLSDVYPNWIAFVALCACWCAMLLTGLCRQAAPSGRGKLTLVALPTAAALLAVISAVSPLEGYTRPAWTYTAENALVSFGNRNFPSLSDFKGPFTDRITYVGSAETVDLSQAGPLSYSGRTVLRAASDYTGHVLLRGAALAVYTGTSWEALDDEIYDQYAQNSDSETSPLLFPALALETRKALGLDGVQTYAITVENVGASGSCVYAPYQLAQQDWDETGAMLVNDAYLARKRGLWSQTMSFLPDYDNWVGGQLSADEPAYQDYVYDYYLDVPEELEPVLETVCSQLDDSVSVSSNSTVAKAEMVAGFLAQRCVYDLDTPLTPEGEDFVAYFLTQSQRGYCTHFASAGALMLRYMGIPARYVSGFSVELTAGETVTVPDSAAHAWVEIYLDGYGWYPVDVTPGYTSGGDDETESSAPDSSPLPSQDVDQEDEPSAVVSAAPSAAPSQGVQTPDGSGENSGSGANWAAVLAALTWCIVIAALGGLMWLIQYLLKRFRRDRLNDNDKNRAVVYGYRCLTRLKKWGGTVPEAALDLGRRARFSQHTLSEEERRAMVTMVDRQRAFTAAGLSPVKRLIFWYVWGRPEPTEKQEEQDDATP